MNHLCVSVLAIASVGLGLARVAARGLPPKSPGEIIGLYARKP